ncbi:MAG: cytochrome c biogenesis protein CcsA [Xanthomonadales bacterium]|nr:cytochrome c biogenesis protein CcsA [Xanthomonadales bacterium]
MFALSLAALIAYAVAIALLGGWRAVADDDGKPDGSRRIGPLLGMLAALLHLAAHAWTWQRIGGPDIHIVAALSLVGAGMALVTSTVAWGRHFRLLGMVVYPAAALSVLAYGLFGVHAPESMGWPLQLHAGLALLAYAMLAVAALLALLLWRQERALRRHELRTLMHRFPPLTLLESLMFRLIAAGFLVLTLALLSGALFVDNLFAQHLVHKTVLSILAWLTFCVLLFGRWRYGWRGRRAVRWTLLAMALLLLAFFGSKFVLEVILQRGI